MCPVEKIEPSPKSYDLIPHPPFMYFNKIMGFHKQKKLWAHHPYHIYLSKKKGRSFYWFFGVNFCFAFKYFSGHIGEWITVCGCMR